jgi:hypothetical protein
MCAFAQYSGEAQLFFNAPLQFSRVAYDPSLSLHVRMRQQDKRLCSRNVINERAQCSSSMEFHEFQLCCNCFIRISKTVNITVHNNYVFARARARVCVCLYVGGCRQTRIRNVKIIIGTYCSSVPLDKITSCWHSSSYALQFHPACSSEFSDKGGSMNTPAHHIFFACVHSGFVQILMKRVNAVVFGQKAAW